VLSSKRVIVNIIIEMIKLLMDTFKRVLTWFNIVKYNSLSRERKRIDEGGILK